MKRQRAPARVSSFLQAGHSFYFSVNLKKKPFKNIFLIHLFYNFQMVSINRN